MAAPKKLYSLCCLLMATLFAYSASVQLNDPDWYFWFPLYAGAFVVNLLNWIIPSSTISHVAAISLWLGIYLFIKVVVEDFMNSISGFWSLDLSERVIREKVGSGLVVLSMILHLITSSSPRVFMHRINNKFPTKYVEFGKSMLLTYIVPEPDVPAFFLNFFLLFIIFF
ncbi:uncharacterized protein LOC107424829 [Ziziphus jujuba]|uniref:Uncharacterized protein LOC107424829 n=1 Tax=Ziziphus jujuba TaxID=326968 RepID=A0A6P4A7C9_ZIZJJ|nr:uncharacterized protein LOC107424829 [Ziziphus jujuba]